ncbi:MAG TPA: hypothetical protein VHW44_29945 [Pseudonocardiaceae bacterium]|jgi:hypothetical protein|nr:hypothetical protein [Pseudonocardiaceae bacterium]
MTRTQVLAVLLAGALFGCLTACSTAPAAPTEPELTGVRAVTVPVGTPQSLPPGDLTVKDRNCGELTGPHYTVGIAWIATGQVLDEFSAQYLDVQPIQAAPGQRLTIVSIDPTVTEAPFAASDPIFVDAVVDGHATTLPGLPLPDTSPMPASNGELIMISAPTTATLQLRATDDGRAQLLDLRTGQQSGSAFTHRDSTVDGTPSATSNARLTGPGHTATATLSAAPAFTVDPNQVATTHSVGLADYQEGIGWAPPGQAFATLSAPQVSCVQPSDDWFCAAYTLDFTDSTAFSFTPTGGTAIPADAQDRTVNLDGVPDDSSNAVIFRVPATTTGGTITWNLGAAHPTTDTTDGTMHWSTPPQPFTIAVTFGK